MNEADSKRGGCVAIIMPLRERMTRPCGNEPTRDVGGRKLCARHARRAEKQIAPPLDEKERKP